MNSSVINIIGAEIVASRNGEKFVRCLSCNRVSDLFWVNNIYCRKEKLIKSYYRCCNCENYIIIHSVDEENKGEEDG